MCRSLVCFYAFLGVSTRFLKSQFLQIPGCQKPWPYLGRLQQAFVCLCMPRWLDLLSGRVQWDNAVREWYCIQVEGKAGKQGCISLMSGPIGQHGHMKWQTSTGDGELSGTAFAKSK